MKNIMFFKGCFYCFVLILFQVWRSCAGHVSREEPSPEESASSRALIVFDGGTTDNFGATDIFLWFSCVVIFAKSVLACLTALYLALDPIITKSSGYQNPYKAVQDTKYHSKTDFDRKEKITNDPKVSRGPQISHGPQIYRGPQKDRDTWFDKPDAWKSSHLKGSPFATEHPIYK